LFDELRISAIQVVKTENDLKQSLDGSIHISLRMETIGLFLAAMSTAGVEFEWPNTLMGA